MTPQTDPLDRAFEHVGRLAEHLTGAEMCAADLDDEPLSRDLVQARRLVTNVGIRLARLKQLNRETTGGAGSTLDGLSAGASQGG